MAVATFSSNAFIARYPEFTPVSTAVLSGCFDDAGLYLDNSDASPVQDISKRTRLLWMLTAHIAVLGGCFSADGRVQPVGRMSQASEGSVSASFEYTTALPGTGAWFQQTQYGASFWQATVSLRGMRYIPNPTRY